jgi:hypothetical protein
MLLPANYSEESDSAIPREVSERLGASIGFMDGPPVSAGRGPVRTLNSTRESSDRSRTIMRFRGTPSQNTREWSFGNILGWRLGISAVEECGCLVGPN